ncbi:pyridoxal-phosphate dependent enzyme [Haloquadratum walsbyi]|jgi:L-threonine synthase (EC 4.2.3.1)|uniref:Threonine synthase n=1 Tax=Haloquadratum walsbyi J07HQW2 TaxID=1238425 RepID=U1N0H0_9EURY|nr:pyridoxal-phosphate dependent enzyme [Haloquadratum walsbyi]ERG96294.1 MAG: threonine synthase [Haloquadratum walsbyi J07HQW2]
MSALPISLQLYCHACGRRYNDNWVWRCDCDSPLDFAVSQTPDGAPLEPPTWSDITAGLWTFADLLPVEPAVSLGEGFTPLVESKHWDAEFKLEYVFPTGSFKDRGATVMVSTATRLGADRVVEDSSGNAGAAVATYAARAGIDAEIYVPASIKPAKRRVIERTGATPVSIEGSREQVTKACVEAVKSGETWYASHAWNPAFFEGTATFAYEVCAQRGWNAPDAVVMPLGHGTLFLGAYRGFVRLMNAGWIDSLPRLFAAQAAGYAPIASELHDDSAASTGINNRADGIQITAPVRHGQILAAIDATDGDAIALSADAIDTAVDALHTQGFYTEPTCAIAPAALGVYRDQGVITADDDVVVPLTGSGFKSTG